MKPLQLGKVVHVSKNDAYLIFPLSCTNLSKMLQVWIINLTTVCADARIELDLMEFGLFDSDLFQNSLPLETCARV